MKTIDDDMKQSQKEFLPSTTRADEIIRKIQGTSQKFTQKIGQFVEDDELELLKKEAKNVVDQDLTKSLERVVSSVKRTQTVCDAEIAKAEKELNVLLS